MAVQAGAGGTVLAGDQEVNATISTPTQNWAGSALFAGAGNFAPAGILLMQASGAFAGSGSAALTGALQLSASAAVFAAAGNLTAELAKSPLFGTVNFAAAGSLIAATDHFTAGIYDETGATGSLSISAGAFTELEFGLQLDIATVANGDILSFRVYRDGVALSSYDVTPIFTASGIPVSISAVFAGSGALNTSATLIAGAIYATGLLAGVGNLSITPRLLAAAQAAFAGSGTLSATPQLWMRGQTDVLAAAGSLVADSLIAGLINASALFAGLGALTATARLWMAAGLALSGQGLATITPRLQMRGSAAMAGAGLLVADLKIPEAIYQGAGLFAGIGNLNADALRFINLTDESFAGIGSLDAASALFLPSDAVFGAEGLLSIEVQNQMFAEVAAFGAFGSMVVDAQRYGSDAGRFICDLDADMTMGDLMAAIATNSLNTMTETNSLNTTIRCD